MPKNMKKDKGKKKEMKMPKGHMKMSPKEHMKVMKGMKGY